MDPKDLSGPYEQETVAASDEETIVQVQLGRSGVTIFAETTAFGAAILALVVPVFSGGIDPASGVVFLVVLLTPMYLHASVRRNMRREYEGRSIFYAVAALLVSAVFSIGLLVAIVGNKPMCIDRGLSCGDLAQSVAQQVTSTCFTASIVLYLLSGIVGLFAVGDNRITT